MKHPRVYFRKLGRERADGQAVELGRKKYIEIDPTIRGKRLLEVFIHERLHFIFPELNEEGVENAALTLSDFLWKHNYRQMDNELAE